MHTILLKRKRKGQKWLTSETIIFFFGALLLIATIVFFFRLQSAVFAEEDDGSIANLKRLNEEIKGLLGTSDPKDYSMINYFIGEYKMLLGFDRDADGAYSVIANSAVGVGGVDYSAGKFYKPFDCGNSACLCLYNGAPSHDIGKSNQGVLRCEREGTGKNILFSSPNIFKFGDQVRRTRHIYIEKTKNTDNSHTIYIDLIDTSDVNDPANKRKQEIDILNG